MTPANLSVLRKLKLQWHSLVSLFLLLFSPTASIQKKMGHWAQPWPLDQAPSPTWSWSGAKQGWWRQEMPSGHCHSAVPLCPSNKLQEWHGSDQGEVREREFLQHLWALELYLTSARNLHFLPECIRGLMCLAQLQSLLAMEHLDPSLGLALALWPCRGWQGQPLTCGLVSRLVSHWFQHCCISLQYRLVVQFGCCLQVLLSMLGA